MSPSAPEAEGGDGEGAGVMLGDDSTLEDRVGVWSLTAVAVALTPLALSDVDTGVSNGAAADDGDGDGSDGWRIPALPEPLEEDGLSTSEPQTRAAGGELGTAD